jgi:hypothetical protein
VNDWDEIDSEEEEDLKEADAKRKGQKYRPKKKKKNNSSGYTNEEAAESGARDIEMEEAQSSRAAEEDELAADIESL